MNTIQRNIVVPGGLLFPLKISQLLCNTNLLWSYDESRVDLVTNHGPFDPHLPIYRFLTFRRNRVHKCPIDYTSPCGELSESLWNGNIPRIGPD